MTPFGSVGGCQNKVMEDAVMFAMVTFCGGSNGSAGQKYKTVANRPKESQWSLNNYMTPACAVVKLMWIKTPPSPSLVQLETDAL